MDYNLKATLTLIKFFKYSYNPVLEPKDHLKEYIFIQITNVYQIDIRYNYTTSSSYNFRIR